MEGQVKINREYRRAAERVIADLLPRNEQEAKYCLLFKQRYLERHAESVADLMNKEFAERGSSRRVIVADVQGQRAFVFGDATKVGRA